MLDTKQTISEQEVVTDSVCGMCKSSCPTKVHVLQGKAIKIDMVAENMLDSCPRWKAQVDFVYHPDRLKYPLKRIGERGAGSFERISWDEALATVADKLLDIKAKYGAESVVFYVSYPNEPRPYFHRLAHAFGSPNYCTESSNCSTATRFAEILNFGGSAGTISDTVAKCELAWSSSVKHSRPGAWKDYLAAKEKGLKSIVVDPRRTEIASMANIHLQLRPGTDGALALGLLNVIINEQLYDKEFVEKWTVGFDGLKKLVQEYPPEKVEQITWVPATKVREAAVLFATEKPARIRTSPGAVVHCSNGVQNQRAVMLLSAVTGNLGVPGGDQDGTRRRGPQLTNDVTLHERIANFPPGIGSDRFPLWTTQFREMQSNTITDRIESGEPYPIKALYGVGLNIMFFPNTNRFVENIKKLDLIVVNDYFHNPSTQLADIVLPVASWLERYILETRGRGGTRFIEPAIAPIGESWPEWNIFAELAKRLGFGNEFWDGDFEKCLNYILEPSGITVADLRQHSEETRNTPPPTPPIPSDKFDFQTPSGKVEISSSFLAQHGHEPLPVYKEPAESPISRPDLVDSFPLVLTSGARTIQFTHSQFRNIPRLRKEVPEALIEINPTDAEARGIQPGDMVTVKSPRGSIRLKANVTDTILPRVVHAMHHWPGEANVNILIDNQNLDPISGFAPFKSQLCQVTKA